METVEAAQKAIKKLQNFTLDEHALKLSIAQKANSIEDLENQQKKSKLLKKRKQQTELSLVNNEEAKSNKLMVKNLAFEATPEDVKMLFKPFGAVKKVRLPKKVG